MTFAVPDFAPLTDEDVPYVESDAAPTPPADLAARTAALLDGLDTAQAGAVATPASRALIVAGPGSGKTRVLTRRMAWLTGHDEVPASHVMAITFTNKAAAEMKERVESQLGSSAMRDAWIGTFHSICARLLRRSGDLVGVPRDFYVADSDDSRRILKRLLIADGADGREALKIADDIARQISSAKNRLEDPTQHRDKIVAQYAAGYRAALAQQCLVDFDDLLIGAVRLLGDPTAGPRIRSRFTHILVDEYQDTNVAQWELLRRLVGTSGSIFAVGDASQSIYGFRGSTPAAMEQFRDDWPDSELHELGRNWRSTARIVAVGDAFGAETGVRRRAKLWTDAHAGDPVRVTYHHDDREEARRIASEVRALGQPWSERAILVRTHATTRLIEAELASASLPYVVVGGTRFWDRAEVRDALAWVRLATNPGDIDAFRRAAGVPRRGLGEKSIEGVIDAAATAGIDVAEWIELHGEDVPRAGRALAAFVSELETVRIAAADGPAAAVNAVLAIDGFVAGACRAAGRADTAEDREANLDELRSAAETFEPEDPEELRAAAPHDQGWVLTRSFCASAALTSATDVNGDGVRITTVHAAKGREFDDVWVLGVEDGLFPHSRLKTEDEINEECRLLFVAATRARKRLTLSWAGSRMMGGKIADCLPSPFLALLQPLAADGGVITTGGALEPHRRRPSAGQAPAFRRQPVRRPAPGAGAMLGRPATTPRPPVQLPPGGYAVSQQVRHDTFGVGTVLEVKGDMVKIRFGTRERTLMASMAPMALLAS